MILIDKTLNIEAVGNNLTDLKEFVKAQPPTTAIGIGYMANARVNGLDRTIQLRNVVQQFTTDHEAAVNALRLRGEYSVWASPLRGLSGTGAIHGGEAPSRRTSAPKATPSWRLHTARVSLAKPKPSPSNPVTDK